MLNEWVLHFPRKIYIAEEKKQVINQSVKLPELNTLAIYGRAICKICNDHCLERNKFL